MFPWMAAGSALLGGIFGGGPSMPAGQRNLLRMQHRAGRELQDFSRGVPGSDPGEMAALASQRGLLGQQQRGMMGGLFGNMGAMGSPAPMDMMSNLGIQFGGQQSALTGQHFINAQNARRQALIQSAQIAQGAMPASQMQQGGMDWGGILGQLGQGYAFQQAMKRGSPLQQQQPGTVNVGGFGGGGFPWRGGPMAMGGGGGGRGPFGF